MIKHTPTPYSYLVQQAEAMPNDSLQKELFTHELYCLARGIKQRFPKDARSVKAIAELIVKELLDGRWDYKTYLARKKHTPYAQK